MTVKSVKEPNTRNESFLDKPRLLLHVESGIHHHWMVWRCLWWPCGLAGTWHWAAWKRCRWQSRVELEVALFSGKGERHVDLAVNANFADCGNDSSLINTDVTGITISTSSRLVYRLLNVDRSWMYGLNAGYDSRPLTSGVAEIGVSVSNTRTKFFSAACFQCRGGRSVRWSWLCFWVLTNLVWSRYCSLVSIMS